MIIIVALAMLLPGCLKLYAASKLARYRAEPAGMITFCVHLLHGMLWTILGIITLLGALFGNIVIDLPWVVSTLVALIFFADRTAAALESLWIAGVLPENFLRKIKRVE